MAANKFKHLKMKEMSWSPTVCVQGTNDSSVLSKCSMVQMGYFEDPFIAYFVTKRLRRSPLINRGYYVRAKAIETIVKLFLDSCGDHSPIQIISLGAGFDSLYFRIAVEPLVNFENINFVEVDFMDVARRKLQIIRSQDKLRNLIKNEFLNSITDQSDGEIVLNSSQYKLLGLDLRDLRKMNFLLRECQVDFEMPTMFLSECAITYMNANNSNDLIRWASTNFSNSMFAVYEQILPSDGFGQVMCHHFAGLNASLGSIHDHPDIESQKRRYQNLGWPSCDAIDMNTFVEKMIKAEEIIRIDGLELFDEFEEFHTKCSHYVLMVATKGTVQIGTFPAPRQISQATSSQISTDIVLSEIDEHGIIKRFGHRSECFENTIITIGGFGVSTKGGHSRLKDICITDIRRRKDLVIPMMTESLKSKQKRQTFRSRGPKRLPITTHAHPFVAYALPRGGGRMFHSLSRLSDGRLVMIGGRGSPVEPYSDITVFDLTKTRDKPSADTEVNITVVQPVETQQQIRWRHSATVVHIRGREGIFVFGGRNATTPTLGDCHILYADTWQWMQLVDEGAHPSERHSHSACLYDANDGSDSGNNRVVVSGGLDVNQLPLADIHIFDCLESRWSHLDTATGSVLPRYSHTSHVWKNKLILLGGVSAMATVPPGIGIVDLTTGNAREVALLVTSKPFLFNKHSSVLDEQAQQIVILGGGGTCFSFGTHFNQSAYVFQLRDVELDDL